MLRKITKIVLMAFLFLGWYFSFVPKVSADLVIPCPPGEYCPPRPFKPFHPQSGYELISQVIVAVIILSVALISLVIIFRIRKKNV